MDNPRVNLYMYQLDRREDGSACIALHAKNTSSSPDTNESQNAAFEHSSTQMGFAKLAK